jgi:hypothetical protein
MPGASTFSSKRQRMIMKVGNRPYFSENKSIPEKCITIMPAFITIEPDIQLIKQENE